MLMKFILRRIWGSIALVASVGCSVVALPSTHSDATGRIHRGMPYMLYRDGMTVFVPANAMENPVVFVAERLDGRDLNVRISSLSSVAHRS